AAMEMEQRARQLAAVVGLLVAKIVGTQQLAGRVVQAVGIGARHEGIGSAFHGEATMVTTTSVGLLDSPLVLITTSWKRCGPTANPLSTTTVGLVVSTGTRGVN